MNNIPIDKQIELNNIRVEDMFLNKGSCGLDKYDEERLLDAFWEAYQPFAYSICREANMIAGEPKWAVDPILRVVERTTIPKRYESLYVVPDEDPYDW